MLAALNLPLFSFVNVVVFLQGKIPKANRQRALSFRFHPFTGLIMPNVEKELLSTHSAITMFCFYFVCWGERCVKVKQKRVANIPVSEKIMSTHTCVLT